MADQGEGETVTPGGEVRPRPGSPVPQGGYRDRVAGDDVPLREYLEHLLDEKLDAVEARIETKIEKTVSRFVTWSSLATAIGTVVVLLTAAFMIAGAK